MSTRRHLLLMFVAFVGLFAVTWYLLSRAERERKPPPQGKPKTTEELLLGTWELVEQDPRVPWNVKATSEFARDGKHVLRLADSQLGPLPPIPPGIYQVQGDTIRFDHPETADTPFSTWTAKIETLTDDTLVLVGLGENTTTKRVVYKRIRAE